MNQAKPLSSRSSAGKSFIRSRSVVRARTVGGSGSRISICSADQAQARQHERQEERRRIAIAEHMVRNQPAPREIGQHRRDQSAGEIAPGLQPPAQPDRDHLRQQQLERHPLRPLKEAQQEQEQQRQPQRHRPRQEPPRNRQPQNLHPHQQPKRHRHRQDPLAMLDLLRADDRRDDAAELLQAGARCRPTRPIQRSSGYKPGRM